MRLVELGRGSHPFGSGPHQLGLLDNSLGPLTDLNKGSDPFKKMEKHCWTHIIQINSSIIHLNKPISTWLKIAWPYESMYPSVRNSHQIFLADLLFCDPCTLHILLWERNQGATAECRLIWWVIKKEKKKKGGRNNLLAILFSQVKVLATIISLSKHKNNITMTSLELRNPEISKPSLITVNPSARLKVTFPLLWSRKFPTIKSYVHHQRKS